MFHSAATSRERKRIRGPSRQRAFVGRTHQLRELMQRYLAPAKNMDSLTANRDKTTRPRTQHRDNHFVPADKEKFLRYLGAAVIMRWNTIPTKLQQELLEHASTLDELQQMPPWRAAITQFLHDRKDDETFKGVSAARAGEM